MTVTMETGTMTRELIDPALFDTLACRVMADDGIGHDAAGRVVEQALGFLVACAANPGSHLSPSKAVDSGWHAFVMHTREYAEFCDRVAGRFIHHHPEPAGAQDSQAGREAIGVTVAAMRAAGVRVDPGLWVAAASCSQCYAGCSDDPKGA